MLYKAREILASCPTQRDLSTAWLDHWEGCSGQCQQARQSWFIFFSQLACQNGLIFYFGHHTGQAHEEQEEDPCVTKILNFLSECNVAIPSSRRKLTIKFMLEKL